MARQSDDDRRSQDDSTLSVIERLLTFLDRNLRQFSRRVRDAIGLTITALLAVVVMHATIAPTYVEGHLLVKKSATDDAAVLGKNYTLLRGNENFLLNDNGYWILPVRGFLPKHNEVQIKDESGTPVASFSFWAPWPVLSALSPSDYKVEVLTYLKVGDASRVKVTTKWATLSPVRAIEMVARSLDLTPVVYAQPAIPRWQVPIITTHLEGIGDIACRDGNWCGTRGESRRLEGFALRLIDHPGDIRLEYRCGTSGRADGGWLQEGQFCGTRGQSKALASFAVRLQGSDADRFTVAYQAHVQNQGDTTIFKNGEFTNPSARIEAIRVWLEQRQR
jgi:hydrophobic W protein